MRILFVSDHDYLPDRVGGRESSIDELANRLAARGHKAQVLVKAKRGNTRRPSGSIYWPINYTIERASDVMAVAERHLAAMRFDVAIYSVKDFPGRIASRISIRRRQVLYVRDATEVDNWTPETFPASQSLLANSEFVANRIRERTGLSPHVVTPVIDFGKYRVEPAGKVATFINPVPHKGVEFAFELVERHPDIPFKFAFCWDLETREMDRLRRRAAQLGNLTVGDASLDVRDLYRETRVLLVPSQWEEGFGRVVIEAQCSGIPVLASPRGGLPEAVGDGGWIIPADGEIDEWSKVLSGLWSDKSLWTEASTSARRRADAYGEATQRNIERIEEILDTLPRPEIISKRPIPKSAAILLPSLGNPAAALQSLTLQNCDHLDIFAFQQPGQDILGMADIEEGTVNIRNFDRATSLTKQVFTLLREIECGFVVLARETDRFDPDFIYSLQSAHLNSLWTAATAVCDVGVVNDRGDTIITSTSGFRLQAIAEEKSTILEDHRDTFGFSTNILPWDTARFSPIPTGIMFRRDALMLLEGAPTFDNAPDLLKFLRFGAHLIGGTLYTDRVLSQSAAPGDAFLGAMPHPAPGDLADDLREAAVSAMLANGIAHHLKAEDMSRTLFGHFSKTRVLALCEGEPGLREVLVKAFIDGTLPRPGGNAG